MKVILANDGVKDVADGYARNYLIPRGLAERATPEALKAHEILRARREAESELHSNLLAKTVADLEGKVITIAANANDKGHLFAAIRKNDIAKMLSLPAHLISTDVEIKTLGDHGATLTHGAISSAITVRVVDSSATPRSRTRRA